MRYRDQPTVEVTQHIRCDVATAWALVTDINLPVRCSDELQSVRWLDDADHVTVGARFRGHNHRSAIGDWESECVVVEVDEPRRWVWNVVRPEGVAATWGFEVDPLGEGVVVRQWARMGPAPSGFSARLVAFPDREGELIARRLDDWGANMRRNLHYIRAQCEQ